jgi:hypothetical protein
VVTTITEWFWNFTVKYEILVFVGNEPSDCVVLQGRTGKYEVKVCVWECESCFCLLFVLTNEFVCVYMYIYVCVCVCVLCLIDYNQSVPVSRSVCARWYRCELLVVVATNQRRYTV